jgi:hypothetical protein
MTDRQPQPITLPANAGPHDLREHFDEIVTRAKPDELAEALAYSLQRLADHFDELRAGDSMRATQLGEMLGFEIDDPAEIAGARADIAALNHRAERCMNISDAIRTASGRLYHAAELAAEPDPVTQESQR